MRLKVLVKTNSSKTEILEQTETTLKISIRGLAKGGKANFELVKLLTKYFNKQVKIVSGFTSKRKVVEISNNK